MFENIFGIFMVWFLISLFIYLFNLEFIFDSEYINGGHILLGILTLPLSLPLLIFGLTLSIIYSIISGICNIKILRR